MSSGSADRANRLAHHLLQIALVFFLVSVMLTILAVWGQRSATASAVWRNPAETIHIEQIAPDLAALHLADAPDGQVLALAMEMGELESTHALLAFGADLTDQQRLDGWLWLAQRYLQAGRDQVAAQAYRLAGSGAVLSEGLPDLLRTRTLLSVGRQLTSLHDKINARFYLTQAAFLGARSPYLSAHHRRLLFEQLVPALLEVGGQPDDWSALQDAISAQRPAGGSVTTARSAEMSIWSEDEIKDAALIRARNDRRAAAEMWLASIATWQRSNPIRSQGSGSDPGSTASSTMTERLSPDQARQALRRALLAEDLAVTQYVTQQMDASETRLLAQETWLRWLLLKRGIARQQGLAADFWRASSRRPQPAGALWRPIGVCFPVRLLKTS
jgi:hypothetical protein